MVSYFFLGVIVGVMVGFTAVFPPMFLGLRGARSHDEFLSDLRQYQASSSVSAPCQLNHCSTDKRLCDCLSGVHQMLGRPPAVLLHEYNQLLLYIDRLKEESLKAKTVEYDPYDTFITTLVAKVRAYRSLLNQNNITVPPDSELLIVPVLQLQRVEPENDDPFG